MTMTWSLPCACFSFGKSFVCWLNKLKIPNFYILEKFWPLVWYTALLILQNHCLLYVFNIFATYFPFSSAWRRFISFLCFSSASYSIVPWKTSVFFISEITNSWKLYELCYHMCCNLRDLPFLIYLCSILFWSYCIMLFPHYNTTLPPKSLHHL